MEHIIISAGLFLSALSVFHFKAQAMIPVRAKARRR
jgi:hypothetical protein